MGEVSIIAIDRAKQVFQLHGACSDGVPARAAAEPPAARRITTTHGGVFQTVKHARLREDSRCRFHAARGRSLNN